jgi:hypothetical protein
MFRHSVFRKQLLIKLQDLQRSVQYLGQGHGFPKYRPPREGLEAFYALRTVQPAVRTSHLRTSYPLGWRTEKDALSLYEEMKPVMVTLRMLGVLPYSVTSTGNITHTDLPPNYKQ